VVKRIGCDIWDNRHPVYLMAVDKKYGTPFLMKLQRQNGYSIFEPTPETRDIQSIIRSQYGYSSIDCVYLSLKHLNDSEIMLVRDTTLGKDIKKETSLKLLAKCCKNIMQ